MDWTEHAVWCPVKVVTIIIDKGKHNWSLLWRVPRISERCQFGFIWGELETSWQALASRWLECQAESVPSVIADEKNFCLSFVLFNPPLPYSFHARFRSYSYRYLLFLPFLLSVYNSILAKLPTDNSGIRY
jgi:hypothetical protein